MTRCPANHRNKSIHEPDTKTGVLNLDSAWNLVLVCKIKLTKEEKDEHFLLESHKKYITSWVTEDQFLLPDIKSVYGLKTHEIPFARSSQQWKYPFFDTVSHIWLKAPDFKRNMLENLFFSIISSYLQKDSIFVNKTIVSWLLGKTMSIQQWRNHCHLVVHYLNYRSRPETRKFLISVI